MELKRKNQQQNNKKGFDRRQHVARVAAKLFNEKGYLETSLSDISMACNFSKGGIYHYFSSKHEILFCILNDYMDLALKDLKETLNNIDNDSSKIQFIITHHLEIYNNNVAEGKTLLLDAHNLPSKYFRAIAEKEREYFQIVAEVFSAFFDGNIEKGELTTLTFTLFGMCNWILYWYNPKGPIPLQGLSEIIFKIFYYGINGYKRLKDGSLH
jgi:TetR/AcrR family transcriptional regulator